MRGIALRKAFNRMRSFGMMETKRSTLKMRSSRPSKATKLSRLVEVAEDVWA